jgi:Icc protein
MLIAQITDAHFGPPGETYWGGYEAGGPTSAVVERLNALCPRPDLVLFTGDLTEEPGAEAYASAGAVLARLDLPLAAIPGNHDERTAFRATFAAIGAEVGEGEFLQLDIAAGPFRLLGLDTVEDARAPAGLLCERRLDWVATRLEETPQTPTLIFMHHPPLAIGIEGIDAIACGNGERLAKIVEGHAQVRRVLCGHVHRSVQAEWAGTHLSVCPAIAWEIGLGYRASGGSPHLRASPGFQLHRIDPAGRVLTHTVHLP